MSLQYFKKEVRAEIDFLHIDKHQSFLQVDFNTSGIKVSYKVILSLLMGIIKHSQSTQNRTSLQYLNIKVYQSITKYNKFAISLQYLKKGS